MGYYRDLMIVKYMDKTKQFEPTAVMIRCTEILYSSDDFSYWKMYEQRLRKSVG